MRIFVSSLLLLFICFALAWLAYGAPGSVENEIENFRCAPFAAIDPESSDSEMNNTKIE